MTNPFTRNSRCAVCGVASFRHEGWFLVAENRWLDRIKVIEWHPQLAAERGIRSVCCREHLKVLIENWTSTASLRLPVHSFPPLPIGSDPRLVDHDEAALAAGRLLGELATTARPVLGCGRDRQKPSNTSSTL